MANQKEESPRGFVLNQTPRHEPFRIHIYPPSFCVASFWREVLQYQIGTDRRIIIKPQGDDFPTTILPEDLQRLKNSTRIEKNEWLGQNLRRIRTAEEVIIQNVTGPSTR